MVCPFGCACHAVRAPGEKWTLLALRREAADGAATVSIYTAPVNHSLGPLLVPVLFLVTCMVALLMAPPLAQTGPVGGEDVVGLPAEEQIEGVSHLLTHDERQNDELSHVRCSSSQRFPPRCIPRLASAGDCALRRSH